MTAITWEYDGPYEDIRGGQITVVYPHNKLIGPHVAAMVAGCWHMVSMSTR